MLNTTSLVLAGFSIITAPLLFGVYALRLRNVNRSWYAILSGAGILGLLALLQIFHLHWLGAGNGNGGEPLELLAYRICLFIVPPTFYFFSRSILFPEQGIRATDPLHYLPLALAFVAPREIAVPAAFLLGAAYCWWLVSILYHLREHRARFQLEFFFFSFFAVMALLTLVLGYSATFIDSAWFYHFYTIGIGLGLLLVQASLLVFPDVLAELHEVVRISYANSTLKQVDVEDVLRRLQQLMEVERLYQNENLSLALLADSLNLSTHQLSELINTRYQQNLSRFIREHRVRAAQRLLRQQPDASILAISMETGFKSQSAFYTAFKEISGESPGQYRGREL